MLKKNNSLLYYLATRIFLLPIPNVLNETLLTHKITTDNSMPVYQKPRRIPQAWEQEIDAKVRGVLDNGIIQRSESPWNSPIILVKKKDSSTRFDCDFSKLNDSTKKDNSPASTHKGFG